MAQSFSKTFKHEMGSLSYKLQEQGRKRLQEPLSLIETLLAVNEKESWSMWMCMDATHLKIFFFNHALMPAPRLLPCFTCSQVVKVSVV